MINSTIVKDQAAAILDRVEAGGARVNFPSWLPDSFYSELTVEVRTERGWENPKKQRNESWDLLCYTLACALAGPINLEHIDWTQPPLWAEVWTRNSLIRDPNKTAEPEPTPQATLATIAAQLL
jgi:phage terminase large subunit GpA-like protein